MKLGESTLIGTSSTSSELARGLRASALALCGSLVASVAAASCYTLPNLMGFSGQDVWSEKDFWFTLGSGVLALGSAALAISASRSVATVTGGGAAGGCVLWVGLALVLFAAWWSFVLFYALWLAPTQAAALLSVSWCWQLQNRERTAQRLAGKSSDT